MKLTSTGNNSFPTSNNLHEQLNQRTSQEKYTRLLLIFCCLFIHQLLRTTTPKDCRPVSYTFTFLSEKLISRCVSQPQEPAPALWLYFTISTAISGKQTSFAQELDFWDLCHHCILVSSLPPYCSQAFQKCTITSLYYFLLLSSFPPQLYY